MLQCLFVRGCSEGELVSLVLTIAAVSFVTVFFAIAYIEKNKK